MNFNIGLTIFEYSFFKHIENIKKQHGLKKANVKRSRLQFKEKISTEVQKVINQRNFERLASSLA